MTCLHCGNEIPESSFQFCPWCGHKLTKFITLSTKHNFQVIRSASGIGMIRLSNENCPNEDNYEEIIPCVYEDVIFPEAYEKMSFAIVCHNNKYGLYKLFEGKEIIPCQYESKDCFLIAKHIACRNEKGWQVFDENGVKISDEYFRSVDTIECKNYYGGASNRFSFTELQLILDNDIYIYNGKFISAYSDRILYAFNDMAYLVCSHTEYVDNDSDFETIKIIAKGKSCWKARCPILSVQFLSQQYQDDGAYRFLIESEHGIGMLCCFEEDVDSSGYFEWEKDIYDHDYFSYESYSCEFYGYDEPESATRELDQSDYEILCTRIPCIYDSIEPINNDSLYKATIGDRSAIYGELANLIVGFEYDNFEILNNRHFKVCKQGNVGILSDNGEVIVPCAYDGIETVLADGQLWEFWGYDDTIYCYITQKEGKYGLYIEYNITLPAIYDSITIKDDMVSVIKEGILKEYNITYLANIMWDNGKKGESLGSSID